MSGYYYRELYQRLYNLSQGTKSIDEYFKEMKLVMIWANVKEDRETSMARFMNKLNRDIAHIVWLYHRWRRWCILSWRGDGAYGRKGGETT